MFLVFAYISQRLPISLNIICGVVCPAFLSNAYSTLTFIIILTLSWITLFLILLSTIFESSVILDTLQWRHNGHYSVSNHQPHHCLLNRSCRRRSKKTPKLHVTGLCAGNSPGTGEFPAQMASNAENVSIWWRHHVLAQWKWTEVTGNPLCANFF